MSQKTTARREKGSGNIYKRNDGNWVGRLTDGKTSEGKPKIKYFSGKTEAEVKRKIREYNKSANMKVDIQKVSVETYILNWLNIYKKDTLKPSSYDRLENTIIHQIIPNIGFLQLQQLTADDIQTLLSKLKKDGFAHSTIKKVYDCLGDVLAHAVINDDIIKNPMNMVKMPEKKLFNEKTIRFFTTEEVSLIIEESHRTYSTNTPVYIYGEAFILMLNTGLRIGELIGLEKSDWNQEDGTLHIQRNIQSVKNRTDSGERTGGRKLVYNSTKTYSGNRIIPLNTNATEALKSLCNKHPESRYIICTKTGEPMPPERLERTFYRLLKNINLDKTGTHSLRHTFASLLFKNGVDVKTVSKLLGHASIQITLNTYIHLIDKTDHNAVTKLDDIF